ncbi:toll/interleukin-1 receptor domain-containing protein [Herbiconiux sp. P18]|uniref:toll/interleukin-1 receptor domain-containing protein n=1 Tax=Herbiconiux liangxiaofengii TaxID=3342795 RepID=UPI0035B74563
MEIFISWSGDQAKQVAEFLRTWLPTVLAGSVTPFVSSQDIAKGDRGLTVIAKELESINYGIVVLTKANVSAPWVNFEAGALAKSLGEGRVSTVLVDVTRADITGPLSQFQDTVLGDKVDVKKLLEDMALAAGGGVPPATRDVLFENLWSELESAVTAASGGVEPTTERDEKNILEEVLDLVRNVQRDVARTRIDLHDRGRFADPAELFDIVRLARMMIDDPSIQDRIASGDIQLIRRALDRARRANVADRHGRSPHGQREQEHSSESEEDSSRSDSAIEGRDVAEGVDEIIDSETGNIADFPGQTIN